MYIVILLSQFSQIYEQAGVDQVTQTITKALDAGTLGIAVLLSVGLIIMGGGIVLLVWKVIVPLLKQVIQLASQVTTLIERTSSAIQHSNETNTLQTAATNVQTGSIQAVEKAVGTMSKNVEGLTVSLGSFKTSTDDGISGFRGDMEAHKTEVIEHLLRLMDMSTLAAKKDDQKIVFLMELNTKLDNLFLLYPPPLTAALPANTIPLNGNGAHDETDELKKTG